MSAWHELDDDDQAELSERFRDRIFPVLTPLAVDPGHPFPYVSDLSLNLAVVVRDPRTSANSSRVKVPNTLPRWLRIGDTDRFVPLEEVIAAHLDQLFPGMEVQEHHAFRVTRNADLSDALDEADDLLSAVEYELRRRRFGRATRLEVDASMTDEVLDLLLGEFDLDPSAVYVARTPLDPTSFNEIADIERPALRWPEWKGVVDPRLQPGDEPVDIFAEIELVMFSFSTRTSRSAARSSSSSTRPRTTPTCWPSRSRSTAPPAAARSSMPASRRPNRASRSPCSSNSRPDSTRREHGGPSARTGGGPCRLWPARSEIHTKIAMAVREEPDGIRRYCHIGTGNYNHRTARIYEDIGILTADPEIGADVADLFNHLTGYGREIRYNKLLVAPDQLRPGLEALIDNEIASGRGRMILKMNSLVDVRMTEKLYEASQAGVDIDLIIRGQCSLKPGIPGLSDRIRVRSIIGRYLEHSRIYHFANGNGPASRRPTSGLPT